MTKPLPSIALLALGASGCAFQATSGPSWAGQDRSAAALTVGASTWGYRNSGAVVGGRVGMAIDHGLIPHQGVVTGGYDWRVVPGWVSLQPGLDLGLGGPVAAGAYPGIGAYLGAAATARVRICGVNDAEPSFTLIAPVLELVVTGRGGGWMPPEGNASTALVGEYAVEMGLRIALGTDVAAEAQGKVQAPASKEGRP